MLNFTLSHTPNGLETRTLSHKDGNLIYELDRKANTQLTDSTYCSEMLNKILGNKVDKELIQVLSDIFTSPTLNTNEMYNIVRLINSLLTSNTSIEVQPSRKSQMYIGKNLYTSEDFSLDTVNNSTTLIQGKSGSGKTYLLDKMLTNFLNEEHNEKVLLHLACSEHGSLLDNLCYHYQVSNVANFEDIQDMAQFAKYIVRSIEIRQKRLEELGYGSYEQYRQGETMKRRPITLTPLLIVLDEVNIYYDKLDFGNHTVDKLHFDRLLFTLQRTGQELGIHVILTSQDFEHSKLPKRFIKGAEQFIGLDKKQYPFSDINNKELEIEFGTAWYVHKDNPENIQKISLK